MSTRTYEDFIGLYKLSKTLRFELKPVGETAVYLEDFKNHEFARTVEEDSKRAEDYKVVKKIIDKFHREFIDNSLEKLKEEDINLIEAFELYKATKKQLNSDDIEASKKQREEAVKKWKDVQAELRRDIAKCFEGYKDISKQDLFKKLIPSSETLAEDEKKIAHKFNGFTTYFKGFHDNRENMYKADGSTAIAFRLVEQNLPKFFDNIMVLNRLKDSHPELFHEISSKVENIETKFSPNYFLNTLNQEGIDKYNELIGGKVIEQEKIHGINELINLFKQKNDLNKLPKMSQLYKQILSESDKVFIDEIKSDSELFDSLKNLQSNISNKLDELKISLSALSELNNEFIYIKGGSALSNISSEIYGKYSFISEALNYYAETELYKSITNKPDSKKIIDSRNAFTKQSAHKLSDLEKILKIYEETQEDLDKKYPTIKEYLISIKLKLIYELWSKLLSVIESGAINKNRRPPQKDGENGGEGFEQIKIIQEYLDSILEIIHRVKPLYLFTGRKPIDLQDKDLSFYADFDSIYEELESVVIPIYNKTRNYLAKKPYSKEKIKINFSHGTLLDGWDVNKERNNLGTLFVRNGKYYLGIISRDHKKILDFSNAKFAYEVLVDDDQNNYKKMFYKYLAGPNKMLPKVFFCKKNISFFAPSEDVLRIRNTSSFTKNGEAQKGFHKAEFNLDDCHTMIDFYKESISKQEDWKNFGFNFKSTSEYSDISEFYRDIDRQAYKINFANIKQEYIDKCVSEGKLYLFEIYNKDFSQYSKGTPNLHTLYWKAVFEPWLNGVESPVKLNGEAEIFYRQHSIKIDELIKHTANQEVENKNPSNKKRSSVFKYDIIKDKRFTQDKFFFHVPIQLNYKEPDKVPKFNDKVNLFLRNNPKVNIIGIDRGEKNLLYYTVIDQSGRILEQASLNSIFSKLPSSEQDYEVNYHSLLDRKEKERDLARKTWSTIENIKELKSGYLSHVIHKLANLVVKYNAIVVLEDLNGGFKRSRTKVEKQVYQKFELALIKKLSYLVFKNNHPQEAGSFLNAYQLVPQINTLKDLNRQTGIVFYVNPAHTSKIDPLTGFVNLIDLRYSSLEKSKELIRTFNSIRFNSSNNYFEFDIDYKKSVPNKESGSKTRWLICTHGNSRYSYDPNTKKTESIDITDRIVNLLNEHSVNYSDGSDIKEKILDIDSASFYKNLLFYLRLTMTLRHCNNNAEDIMKKDFILSPVKAENGRFFNSGELLNIYSEFSSDKIPEPLDSDANGAYHIALKGLLFLERINHLEDKKKLELSISNKDWFEFIHGKRNTNLLSK
jgi:CRISPR-associated protein Cpf1